MPRIARQATVSTRRALVGTLAAVLSIAAIPGLTAVANATTTTSGGDAQASMFDAVSPAVTRARFDPKIKKTRGGLPPSAVSEVDNQPVSLLGWPISPANTQGVTALASSLARYQVDTTDWATARGDKSSFSVALVHDNWGMDVSFNHPNVDANWYFGYFEGSTSTPIKRCLWLGTASLDPAGNAPTHDCTNTSDLAPKDFMILWNGNYETAHNGVPANCTPDHQCDGTDVRLNLANCPNGVPVFSNMQPWQGANGTVGDYLYTIPSTPSTTIKWRYVTKDYRAVMMRYTGSRNGVAQDWGFVPTQCVATPAYYEWVS